MDDWSKQFFDSLSAATQAAESWWMQSTDELTQAVDGWVSQSDQWAEQLQQALEPELERLADDIDELVHPWEEAIGQQLSRVSTQLEESLEPWVLEWVSQADAWMEQVARPVNNTLDPLAQSFPACVGCRHYHGQSYGGNLLVCAMYPYGPETETCGDWASVWTMDRNDSDIDS